MNSLKINHKDGSVQVINVSSKFDGNYHHLAIDITKDPNPSYKIIGETKKRAK